MTPEPSLADSPDASIVGIDLAWGSKRPDGLCLIRATREHSEIVGVDLSLGDADLQKWLAKHIPASQACLLSIDAPLVVPNAEGCRPVDRQISVDFGKYHAACHSANAKRCVRPLRVAQLLRENGFTIGFDLSQSSRVAAEVYPHPAIIRLFELERIVKYKKGLVEAKRREFTRLQDLLKRFLTERHPDLSLSLEVKKLLSANWNKGVEDQTDALFCALIGYLHWRSGGHLSQVAGTLEEGFILLPPVYRNGFALMNKRPGAPLVTMEMVNRMREED